MHKLSLKDNLNKDIHIRVSQELLEQIEKIAEIYQLNKSSFTRKVLARFVTQFSNK
jgi:hypothetical protein